VLRNKADYRTLAFAFITTCLFGYQWITGEISFYTYPLYLLLSVIVTVIAHNHNHVPIWRPKILNQITDYWLTVFYGFPAFGWIPTHNMNHHSLNNKEGDYTITYRFTEKNHLLSLLTYPTISSYFQQKPIRDYLKSQKEKDRSYFYYALSQYVVLALWIAAAFFLDWRKALYFVVIPQQFGLAVVLIFNYLQHVHADEESPVNHSRNFTGKLLNFLLLNNGYHTVHHDRAGTHWSKNKEAHEKIAHLIDPSLNQRSFWGFLFKSYILALIMPSFGTKSMRLARLKATKAGAPEEMKGELALSN